MLFRAVDTETKTLAEVSDKEVKENLQATYIIENSMLLIRKKN